MKGWGESMSEKDVKELFRKEIAKWKDEDPLFMAYVYGQEAGRKDERGKIICCARCPCKEPDCEDFCKHFQPLDNLMSVIKNGDLIESREALEHHFGRHNTCKSERTRCPLCKEDLRKVGEL